jgi:fermentation-respiration switch protein FrsA (DUF1100 family)
MRHFLVLSCSTVLLFVVGSAWLAFYPPVPTDLAGAENLDVRSRRVRIPLADGGALQGWYLPPRNDCVVLLLHGYGRDHTRTWRYGGFLRRAGYGLLAFDFRSSRAAGRMPTTLGHYERLDASAALAWLRTRPETRHARIAVLGESLGGSVALILGAESPDVRAVVVDCPFADGRQALEDACERWARLPRWPSAALIRTVGRALTGHDPGSLDAVQAAAALRDRPVLFIHSMKDDRISPGQARELWSAAGAKDPIWLVPDAGHNEGWVAHRPTYEARVLSFLDHHLRGRGPGLPSGSL